MFVPTTLTNLSFILENNMKTRNGFVSNSSSSSFIIGLKTDDNECPHCHRRDSNLFDRVDRCGDSFGDDTRLRARGVDATIEALKDWSCREDDEYKKLSEQISNYRAMGYEIGWIEISYHDDSLNDEFRALRETGKAVVILDNN